MLNLVFKHGVFVILIHVADDSLSNTQVRVNWESERIDGLTRTCVVRLGQGEHLHFFAYVCVYRKYCKILKMLESVKQCSLAGNDFVH